MFFFIVLIYNAEIILNNEKTLKRLTCGTVYTIDMWNHLWSKVI